MNYTEFLKEKNVHITTSATKLQHMLASYVLQPTDFKKTFEKMFWTRDNGDNQPGGAFLSFIGDNFKSIQSFDPKATTIFEAIKNCFTEIIESKKVAKTEFTKQKILDSLTKPDYTTNNEKCPDEDVELFSTTLQVKPNQHDRNFYRNFTTIKNSIIYSCDGTVYTISTDLKGEGLCLMASDYGSDPDCLYNKITKDMASEYEHYMKLLKAEVTKISKEDLDAFAPDDFIVPPIEKIFLNDIPTSFRKIVKIKKCYTMLNGTKTFAKFSVLPLKGYGGAMPTLAFDDFFQYLMKNFVQMTKGACGTQKEYLAWSNDFTKKAVSTWPLPDADTLKKAVMPKCWHDFLDNKASPHLMSRLYFYLGAIQDASNTAQQALVISDLGRTGKGTIISVLKSILPERSMCELQNSYLNENNSFGLSSVNAQDAHLFVLNEYDGESLNGTIGKQLIASDSMNLNVKNRNARDWCPKGNKVIASTNHGCSLKENAIRCRIIPVTFTRHHSVKDNFSDAQLAELKSTAKDFLNWCYKIYLECPLKNKKGEYIVMNPEQEKAFLKTGELDANEDHRIIKAFSEDEEISQFFSVNDFSNSEANIDFQSVIESLCERSDDNKDFIWMCDMRKHVESYIQVHPEYKYSFNAREIGGEICIANSDWRRFTAFMLNNGYSHKPVYFNKHHGAAWVGLKLIPDALHQTDTEESKGGFESFTDRLESNNDEVSDNWS